MAGALNFSRTKGKIGGKCLKKKKAQGHQHNPGSLALLFRGLPVVLWQLSFQQVRIVLSPFW